jgi:site-specific DNA-cytosine methylase
MDNLIGLTDVVSPKRWKESLPMYDFFPELVSNYNYGNVQKKRVRFFVIGARNDLLETKSFKFFPDEYDRGVDLFREIEDLLENPRIPELNHFPHRSIGPSGYGGPGSKMDWSDVVKWFSEKKPGTKLTYVDRDGKKKTHIGVSKSRKDFSFVLSKAPVFNPWTNLPFSLRERLRIQGAPDDFVLKGVRPEEDGTWDFRNNLAMMIQTGKFMPVQFCKYVSITIARHLQGLERNQATNRRSARHPKIDDYKMKTCSLIDKDRRPCEACWISNCNLKKVSFSDIF